MKLPGATENDGNCGSFDSRRKTRRSGSAKGNGRNSTVLTTLKTAVDAPIPRASVSTAMAANDFVRQSPR